MRADSSPRRGITPDVGVNIAMGYVPFDGTLDKNGFPCGKIGQQFKAHLPPKYADTLGVPVEAKIVKMPFTPSHYANIRDKT